MDARSYLEELWQIDRRIRDKQELREHYLNMACRATPSLSGLPSAAQTGDGPVAEYGIKLMDIERELAEDVRRMEERYRVARAAIRRLPDPRHRDVLELRYFRGLQWEDIARRLHYERTQVWRMHVRALEQETEYLPVPPARATGCNAAVNAAQRKYMV